MNNNEEKSLICQVISEIYLKARTCQYFLDKCKSQRRYIHDKKLLGYFDSIEKKYYDKLKRNIAKKKPKRKRLWGSSMTEQERHERNGIKGVEIGYSSTGVKLPTYEEMKQYAISQRSKLKQYYKSHPDEKRPSKMFINVSMGGHNKRY